MPYQADVVAYDPAGNLILVVEVKTKRGASGEWAAQMRRNLAAHGIIHSANFFLLALPDHFFLWKGRNADPSQVSPDYEIDSQDLLLPYFQAAGIAPDKVSGQSFELIVGSWLRDLVQTSDLDPGLKERHPWLVESGLFQALQGGR